MMKHKWVIEPRGKKTKYYICSRCGTVETAVNLKEADIYGGKCQTQKRVR